MNPRVGNFQLPRVGNFGLPLTLSAFLSALMRRVFAIVVLACAKAAGTPLPRLMCRPVASPFDIQ